jgi:hypothetical protein
VAMEAIPASREEVGRVGRRRKLAEARARGGGNGGRRCSHAGGEVATIYSRARRGEFASQLSIPTR